MRFLRTNTAVIITVGPFYDKTDGVTIETALTITNERITLTADTDDGSAPTNILDNVTGATSGTSNDLNYITGNDAGMMQLELSAANTNRLGRMFLSITDAANHVPVFHEFMVVPALVYDTYFASTGGATFPAATLASTTNITAGTITTTTNLTNLPAITSNWLTAAGIAASALNGKGDWNIGKTGYALSSAGIQAIWDALTSALTTVGSIGKLLVDNINATISSRASQTSLDTLDDYVDSEVAAIKAKTDQLTFTVANQVDANALGLTGVDPTTLIDEIVYPYIALVARKDAAIATDFAVALGKINADYGSGAGAYDNATDSQEAIRDRGDAAWGGAGSSDWTATEKEHIRYRLQIDGTQTAPAVDAPGQLPTNAAAISGDTTAADNLETMLDGTGGATLSLGQLNVVNSAGSAIVASSTGGNGHGIAASGNGSGNGLSATGGATGHGINGLGGATSGDGMRVGANTGTNGNGLTSLGRGTGRGIDAEGVSSGAGIYVVSGTGNGIEVSVAAGVAGHGISVTGAVDGIRTTAGNNGHGLNVAGAGSGHGVNATGGATGNGIDANGGATSGDGINATAATSGDGMELVGAGGGYDLNADIQGTISGTVNANVTQVSGDSAAADNLEADYDGTGYNKSASTIGTATALGATERNNIADALLKRDWTAVTGEAARSVLNALVVLLDMGLTEDEEGIDYQPPPITSLFAVNPE